jgi:transcription antitermination factor NusG
MDKSMEWYAITTRSRHEKQVDSFLSERGIETFLPLVHTLSRRRDRKKYVDLPLFPGYMFVCTDKERLFDIKFTRGVTRIIGTDIDAPTPIPEKQILDLKSIAESEVQLDQYAYLKKGRAVRVKAGPLKGLEGILVERKGHYKLVIRIDLLQKGAAAEVFISDVDPI